MAFFLPIADMIDFAGSLSILVVLAVAYGAFHRRLVGGRALPIVLGGLFGVVSILQMFNPIEPIEGLIIDSRNVPVALAGAFLGWRGFAVSFILAAGTRLGVGGVGANSGVLAMAIAGWAGIVWSHVYEQIEDRNAWAFLILAVAMSAHFLAAVVLPYDIAIWFLLNAAPSLLILNLLCVPIAGFFMNRELKMIAKEKRMQAAALADPESGLMTAAAFQREFNLQLAAHPLGTYGGLLVIELRHKSHVSRTWGEAVKTLVLGALKKRVSELYPNLELFGLTNDSRIVIPISGFQSLDAKEVVVNIERIAAYEPVNLPNGQRASVSINVDLLDLKSLPEFQNALQKLFDRPETPQSKIAKRASKRVTNCSRFFSRTPSINPEHLPIRSEEHLLFQKADLLFAARQNAH